MSPASGPVSNPKLFPAATQEDQADVASGNVTPIVMGAAPYSSPDPATDGIKMLPIEDGTSAYDARGPQSLPSEDEADELDSQEWKDRIAAAEDQEQLDALAQAYDNSGSQYKTVKKAIEKKQSELDAASSDS